MDLNSQSLSESLAISLALESKTLESLFTDSLRLILPELQTFATHLIIFSIYF